MAILFSHVTVDADKKIVQFWYAGIPKTLDALEAGLRLRILSNTLRKRPR